MWAAPARRSQHRKLGLQARPDRQAQRQTSKGERTMTDVGGAGAAAGGETRTSPRGDFIWYELRTPDPDGAKAFYDAVVGWNVAAEGPPEYNGYRMIVRGDGGFAAGVLPIPPEMQQH